MFLSPMLTGSKVCAGVPSGFMAADWGLSFVSGMQAASLAVGTMCSIWPWNRRRLGYGHLRGNLHVSNSMVSTSAWVPVVVIGSFTDLGKMDVRGCKKMREDSGIFLV